MTSHDERLGEVREEPSHLDHRNVAVGALVTALLTSLLGTAPIALILATPREEGANIGGGILATLALLVAVVLGSAFTARRAVRRASNPMVEGVAAGAAGTAIVALTAGVLLVAVQGVSPWALEGLVSLAVPGLGAAFLGAAVGARTHRRRSG